MVQVAPLFLAKILVTANVPVGQTSLTIVNASVLDMARSVSRVQQVRKIKLVKF